MSKHIFKEFRLGKINNMNSGMLKLSVTEALFSAAFFDRLRAKSKQHHQPLLKLVTQLRRWNLERITQKTAAQHPTQLTVEDVAIVKQMIANAMSNTVVDRPDVFLDQVFFLSIGAIQTQTQTDSERSWLLVHQSIENYLYPQQDKKPYVFGLFFTSLLVLMAIRLMMPVPPNVMPTQPDDTALLEEQGQTDPVTMSMLSLAYHKMKSGTCQLPQAAMLPPEQRQAFLLFVNSGYIEVNHVEHLRLALGYVNCLYPQELMHPSSDDHKPKRNNHENAR